MKKGFGLLIAIIFVVTIASLGAVALKLSVGTAKQTGDVYVREQGEILLRSFAEYTMLNILTHDFNDSSNPCLTTLKGHTRDGYSAYYRATATIKYFGSIGKCNTTTGSSRVVDIKTPTTKGTVMIDIVVEHLDGINGDRSKIYPVRLHKRIIQKI